MLQQQLTNLTLSQRMKKLGFKQQSHFWWCEKEVDNYTLHFVEDFENDFVDVTGGSWDRVASYSVAELGYFLPEKVVFRNYQKRDGGKWRMNWMDLEISGDTEADMKANYLIYLAEQKLINPNEM